MPIDLRKLEEDVHRRILPRPASPTSSPLTDRAVEALRKAYPADMTGVDIQDMPWTDPKAASTIFGKTSPESEVRVNPIIGAAFPQEVAEETIAHELQHVRQNRASRDPQMDMLRELKIPYEQRPSEIEATNAAIDWNKKHHPEFDVYSMTPPITPQSFPAPGYRR